MLSIIRRIQFILLIFTLVGCSLFFYSYHYLAEAENHNREKDLHYTFLELTSSPYYKRSTHEMMYSLKQRTYYEKRAEKMSDYIQAYANQNHPLIKKRKTKWLDYEKTFLSKLETERKEAKNNLVLALFSAFGISFLNLAFLIHLIGKQILKPVKNLSKKINDFMDGYYTYHFSDPPDNELGNLERSFHLMAEKVIKNMDELKALDEAKSEFMNIVSHELRTPMTSIKGSLNLLSAERMGPIPEKQKKLLLIAEEETNRLIRLTNDFLDLAKIEAKSYTLNKDWYTLNRIIDTAQSSLSGLLSKAGVDISFSDPIPNIEVFVDKDKIQQVILNLLGNAIKYSPEGSCIDISAKIEEELIITIKDKGPGIEEKHLESIFQKFRQANSPDRPLVKGTGLGLSIAKALVEAHDGKVGVHSEYGSGSSFYFSLKDYRQIQSHQGGQAA